MSCFSAANVKENSFQITLPSNASMELFPDNDASEYVTRLCKEISLTGDWEAALIDIQYPRTWRNVMQDTPIGFLVTRILPPMTESEVASEQERLEDDPSPEARKRSARGAKLHNLGLGDDMARSVAAYCTKERDDAGVDPGSYAFFLR